MFRLLEFLQLGKISVGFTWTVDLMKGCTRLERGCPEAEPPVPMTCADRMNADIRFHTDILKVARVKCRRGLDDKGVTEGTQVFSWLNSKDISLHS